MPYRILPLLALLLCLALGASLAAPSGAASRNKTYSLEDSIFIAKHLGVVYSASPKTREKGKSYMYRLLALQPSAKLVDMYVSEEVERIFDKVGRNSSPARGP